MGQAKGRGGAKVSRTRASGDVRERFTGLAAVGLVVLVVIAARLVWIQVVQAPAFAAIAEKQRVRDVTLSPRRGAILDREGQQLAWTVDAKTIVAEPHKIKDPKGAATALAGILGGTADQYYTKLTRDVAGLDIARKVDMDRANAVGKLGIAGISLVDDSKRTYPSGDLACQILGFVGTDDSGLAGIEKQYDAILRGTPGELKAEMDSHGRTIPGGTLVSVDPVDGHNVYLTIDKDIQYEAQVELAGAVKQFGAKGGSVVVMDPRNGEILAMASTPYFDPNSYQTADPTALRNKVVSDAYEPGSTIKTFTAAAVIDKNIFTPDSMFTLPPTLKVADRTIHDSEARGTVDWSLTTIVTKSSNIGAVKLGQALGPNGLYDYFSRFGLTAKTGIDFPGETKGYLPKPSLWSKSSIGNIPFGQGISVSVVQLCKALSGIANHGTLVTPHLLLHEEGDTQPLFWPTESACSSATAAQMVGVLENVVNDGTGTAAKVTGYQVAGKTGTAQKPLPNGAGYASGKYVASFAGFLPADDPRIMIVVTIDEPSGTIFGGSVAAPAFSRIAQFCVAHLKIPPSAVVATPPAGASAPAAKTGAKTVAKTGNGKVTKTIPAPKPTPGGVVESTGSVR
jgi:cell division protein FtsI (penicillin-binding protein 3)